MLADVGKFAPADWVRMPVEDVCREVTSGGTPSRRNPAFYRGGQWAWVKTQELRDAWLDDTEEHITDEAVKESSAKVLPPNTVLMAMYGATVGQLGILRRPMTCNQACCAMIVDETKADARYLFYQLLLHRAQFRSSAVGAAQQNLSGQLIRRFTLPFPRLQEQQAIAHILGCLDDKIELNRRMNETLEAMARAIFKSWFVGFDPVRAKMEGRQPVGMDAETAALFPDEFEEAELGRIPRGWAVTGLDEIADFLNGIACQKHAPEGDDHLPVIKIRELRSGITSASDRASPDIDPAYVVRNGDVLFSWSGSLEVVVWCGGVGALNQHIFKVASDCYPKWFYYQWLLRHLGEFRSIAADKATTMGHIRRHHLGDAKVVVPSESVLAAGDHVIAPLIEMAVANRLENRTLAGIRDALLPKLLSGEVGVPPPE